MLIPITHDECLQSMRDQGYEVLYDPAGDGNCQFSSVAFALRDLHIFRSAETLRNEVVSYLNSHDYSSDRIPLELFAGIPWSQYITEMARSGTFGDEITLRTISNMFNAEIVVVSTLGLVRILPENSLPLFQITLGNFAENQSFHYVVLRRDEIVSEIEKNINLNEVELELNKENESTMSLNKVEPELNEENESNIECGNIFDKMLLEILEKIFFYALTQSDNTFPGHVCCTFQNSVAAIPRFNAFR